LLLNASVKTGGGGEFFWENLQRLLKEAKINAYLAAPSHQANVLGQYIYGEAQLSAFFRELREAF
jgi:plasmid segregation protein ParM